MRPQGGLRAAREADVCLIVEGCYPYVRGGVSSWVDWLIRSQPDLTFCIVSIWPSPTATAQYELPANVVGFSHVALYSPTEEARRPPRGAQQAAEIASAALELIQSGTGMALEHVMALAVDVSREQLLRSRLSFDITRLAYEQRMPHAAFLDFFWAWHALFGGLVTMLKTNIPPARVYHATCTGYAGLLLARAARQSGRKALLTEHGIYANERRIEILLADWITDSVERGLDLEDPRFDLRELWISAFESYSRICYDSCSTIVTLYAENQRLQRELGASADRLQVIPNGIDPVRFSALSRPGPGARPTIAFIGRVVPIKDVVTYIRSAALVYRELPDLQALVLGPLDEDPAYVSECRAEIERLQMGAVVSLAGSVDIVDYLPLIHVVVLTSLSEAQPLVLLEAGAAGVPCVATDVGACREIIEGSLGGDRELGPGGMVTEVVATDQIARAALALLKAPKLARSMGETLRQRVLSRYRAETVASVYTDLYASLIGASVVPAAEERS